VTPWTLKTRVRFALYVTFVIVAALLNGTIEFGSRRDQTRARNDEVANADLMLATRGAEQAVQMGEPRQETPGIELGDIDGRGDGRANHDDAPPDSSDDDRDDDCDHERGVGSFDEPPVACDHDVGGDADPTIRCARAHERAMEHPPRT
jgi:hypothetical protein